MSAAVKSKPVYSPLAADTAGRYHVLLGAGEGASCLFRVLDELLAGAPEYGQHTQVLFAAKSGLGGNPFEAIDFGAITLFASTAALLSHAQSILAASLMGTRLYIAGPENFIGRALQIGLSFNLNKDEIRAEHIGTTARRVHCIHCRTDSEDVRTNIVRCAGCARWLQVRDHYSRRYAAYMGVMADAEAPGELPPISEIHP